MKREKCHSKYVDLKDAKIIIFQKQSHRRFSGALPPRTGIPLATCLAQAMVQPLLGQPCSEIGAVWRVWPQTRVAQLPD